MAGELDAAKAELVNLLRDIDGLRNVPENLPGRVGGVYPLGPSMLREVEWTPESYGMVKGLHTFEIGAYVPVGDDLAKAQVTIFPFGEKIKDKLLNPDNLKWNNTIDTVLSIAGTFGDGAAIAGVPMVGWTLRISIKIKSHWNGAEFIQG